MPWLLLGVLAAVLGGVGVAGLSGAGVRGVPGHANPVESVRASDVASPRTPSEPTEPPRAATPAPAGVPATPASHTVPVEQRPGRSPAESHPVAPAAHSLITKGVVLPEVRCALPGAGTVPKDPLKFYVAGLRCLDQAWRPVVTAVGADFASAGLRMHTRAARRCGDVDGDVVTAFYCGADRVIHMPADRLVRDLGRYPPAHLGVLAHEYGHHVQRLTGVLGAVEGHAAGPAHAPREREVLRRVELQAHCFAGLFLRAAAGRGSLTFDEAVAAVNEFARGFDSPTHGTVVNRMRWAETGFRARSTDACDTWSAPSSAVA